MFDIGYGSLIAASGSLVGWSGRSLYAYWQDQKKREAQVAEQDRKHFAEIKARGDAEVRQINQLNARKKLACYDASAECHACGNHRAMTEWWNGEMPTDPYANSRWIPNPFGAPVIKRVCLVCRKPWFERPLSEKEKANV